MSRRTLFGVSAGLGLVTLTGATLASGSSSAATQAVGGTDVWLLSRSPAYGLSYNPSAMAALVSQQRQRP